MGGQSGLPVEMEDAKCLLCPEVVFSKVKSICLPTSWKRPILLEFKGGELLLSSQFSVKQIRYPTLGWLFLFYLEQQGRTKDCKSGL